LRLFLLKSKHVSPLPIADFQLPIGAGD